ncbi:MAG TPA: carbohydrate kinase family protein [Thermomicrobiales bacterium]|nr:carbohydrate kinase family protein [Thermomicrobiales bacterium]
MARIALVGLIDHDEVLHLDHLPVPGTSAVITAVSESPGGTTANTAVALARLGEHVTLRALVGDDAEGAALKTGLEREGVDCTMVTIAGGQPTDRSVILLDTRTGERTILWRKGAMIGRTDKLDVYSLFDHDVVLLDMADEPLRRFLTDLPVHTRPDVLLLGPITYIVDNAEPDATDVAFRFDTITGNAAQFLDLMQVESEGELIETVQHRMPGTNLRAAVVTLAADGCLWITRDEHEYVEGFRVEVRDTIGAGDAHTAGIAYGMARRWSWPETCRFANAVAAMSTTGAGAQAGLPTIAEVQGLVGNTM